MSMSAGIYRIFPHFGVLMFRDVTFRQLMIDEMRSAFGQIGASTPARARAVAVRYPGAPQL